MEENKDILQETGEHEHHHDHEGDCCHEHEHHHHDHDEDEGCGCGEHEHHHDHDECCGHDHGDEHHHHDHGHKYEVAGYKLVETHKHEGATVCSFEKEAKMPAAEAVEVMTAAINNLESWLNESGAVIGHVKGFVKECGLVTTFSTVGGGLNVTSHDGTGASVGFASIVFGPDEETMKDKVIEAFSGLR